MFRFIHSSDLHLGKRFGNFSGDLPSRLREARHAVLGRLAAHANEHGASTILLAGDTFDTETPAADVRRQALTEMAQHPDICWIILPGNHDSLQAVDLWARMAEEAPANVILATEAQPTYLAHDAVVLPSPCTTRRPGRDVTEWMDAAITDVGTIRIGLAHGAIQNFTEDASTEDVIAPDRARRAKLDYLALGDWHGTIQVDPRTYYSGTPEPDRFKHNRPGVALLVSIDAAGEAPQVRELETGTFQWQTMELEILSQDDPAAALQAVMPDLAHRRYVLANIMASGHTRLAHNAALMADAEQAAPDFAWFEINTDQLHLEYEVDDLDEIEQGGALRVAADSLMAEIKNLALPAQMRSVASAALARLYRHAKADVK